jgi:phosphohistidine phosphatase
LKYLFIIRHAKSDQQFFGSDFERPLNERGKHDAPVMALSLLQQQVTIDAFISSPAKRAKKTAELFCKAYQRPEEEIIFVTALYHAPADVFYEVIQYIDDTVNNAAIFSHNPGITDFVNSLGTGTLIDNMPTCGIFAVRADIESWSAFATAKKEFLFFDYPKKV